MNNKERMNTAVNTRKIYHDQHNMYLKDETLFNRFMDMVADINYFHLPENYFKGKTILDAGCGNTAYFQVSMHKYGVKHQTCLDLGDEWITPLQKKLDQYSIPQENIDFVPGSTDALPFPDNHFDFVASNGVLVHLNDVEQAEKAMKELARVTKKGGYLYVIFGASGGLFEEEIIPALRRYYKKNKEFQSIVDNITPDTIESSLQEVARIMKLHTGSTFDYKEFSKLFDWDFCAFIQNILQVPKRHCLSLNTEWTYKQFEKLDFEIPKRCRRYVKRKNIRKFFAPLHFELESSLSQILYGEGNMEWIARKK